MSAMVIVGAQWGDEGKGKIVDLLAEDADIVIRYGGGANAGHTLVVNGKKVVFHLVPSGALHERPRCFLGAGTVIDPKVLCEELDTLKQRGLLRSGRVLISESAHLVMPQHMLVDSLREQGPSAIGTTKRGIGPCYQDRAARRGLRMADLSSPELVRTKILANIESWRPTIESLGGQVPDAEAVITDYLALADTLRPFVGDVLSALHDGLSQGARVLLEGAQGTMLDLDHGTYPFVTSSSVTAAGACTGSGLGPTHISKVLGITKAYTTRVGDGPFPTELFDDEGEALRQAGGEFGATTGRPRRCGWMDIPVLKHAARVNGIGELALTKLDVLSGRKELKICVAYELDGERLSVPPANGMDRVTPVYETIRGFKGDVTECRRFQDLPKGAQNYVQRIEKLVGLPISLISVGPDRSQTIVVRRPWDGGSSSAR